MRKGLEPTPISITDLDVSAPPSADLFLVTGNSRFHSRHLSIPRPSFPRTADGMVDLDAYEPYLVDDPEDVPIEITGEQQKEWVNQHVIFHGSFYEQTSEKPYLRDKVLSEFRTHPNHQMIMRLILEIKVHQELEEHIVPPPIETMKKSLRDLRNLDRLGASVLGRRIILLPEIATAKDGMGTFKSLAGQSFEDATDFFREETETRIEILRNPLVTPQRLVTGVIARTAKRFNSERLMRESQRRIEEDPVYYPMRLRRPGHLYGLARDMLIEAGIIQIDPVKTKNQAVFWGIDPQSYTLQTDENEVRLAA